MTGRPSGDPDRIFGRQYGSWRPVGPHLMSTPAMWWGRDCGDGPWHAVAACDIEAAAGRGWTEALCGSRLPVDVALSSDRTLTLCVACYVGVADDLRDPIRQAAPEEQAGPASRPGPSMKGAR